MDAIFRILDRLERESTGADGHIWTGDMALRRVREEVRNYFDLAKDDRIPAKNFVATLAANVNNPKMNDETFREFVGRTLPIVEGAPKDLGPSGVEE